MQYYGALRNTAYPYVTRYVHEKDSETLTIAVVITHVQTQYLNLRRIRCRGAHDVARIVGISNEAQNRKWKKKNSYDKSQKSLPNFITLRENNVHTRNEERSETGRLTSFFSFVMVDLDCEGVKTLSGFF